MSNKFTLEGKPADLIIIIFININSLFKRKNNRPIFKSTMYVTILSKRVSVDPHPHVIIFSGHKVRTFDSSQSE